MGKDDCESTYLFYPTFELFLYSQYCLLPNPQVIPLYIQEICKTKVYPDELPNTSVVIVFHNEAWSTLLRTVYSVINRSPHYLLSEVILVDDASERDFLKLTLENYVKNLEVPVKIIRMEERSGLIRARLRGAAASKGQVITFLDAHCECTLGWLEPLLARIKEDRKTVVCPIIDVISDDTFEYMAGSDMTYGGFNWKLNFRWYPVPQREMDRRKGDRTLPVRQALSPSSFNILLYTSYLQLKIDSLNNTWGRNIRDMDSVPGLGTSSGGGNGNLPQYSCLENSMAEDPGGLQQRVAKSRTRLSTYTQMTKREREKREIP
ncbi:hypothetical protein FD755_007258 [Muntiacus reevesi]|uniref:Glycosyltransferase 2-like domain-containing protein n=1 Tax=Muntiacus reevesi TaxID=9886 RepID=A0A5J5MGX2_MUNRE|nr:hypothetical protein FD755_007258 [Muntiacus reevesi]